MIEFFSRRPISVVERDFSQLHLLTIKGRFFFLRKPNTFIKIKRGKEWRDLYSGAELVISHAGAGSCLEALENNTRLLDRDQFQ